MTTTLKIVVTDRNIWFVTRQKENAVYKTIENHKVPSGRNIISDETIELTSISGQRCEYYLRRVVAWDDAKNREIVLLSNNLKFGASTISGIYQKRWQIELFFKQIKQNLKIKSFVGTSENAVKIQIYTALCAIVMMRYLKSISDSKRMRCKQVSFSFSNMVTLLRISLFRAFSLMDWLLNPFKLTSKNRQFEQINMCLFGQHATGGGV